MTTDFKTGATQKANARPDGAAKPYLVPFRTALAHLGLDTTILPETITISRQQLLEFTTAILRGVALDEADYLAMYPDVADAIVQGAIPNAQAHFAENGYFEDRFPQATLVDEEWYRAQYPDIAECIELGDFKNCQEHFDKHGRAEGRLPYQV